MVPAAGELPGVEQLHQALGFGGKDEVGRQIQEKEEAQGLLDVAPDQRLVAQRDRMGDRGQDDGRHRGQRHPGHPGDVQGGEVDPDRGRFCVRQDEPQRQQVEVAGEQLAERIEADRGRQRDQRADHGEVGAAAPRPGPRQQQQGGDPRRGEVDQQRPEHAHAGVDQPEHAQDLGRHVGDLDRADAHEVAPALVDRLQGRIDRIQRQVEHGDPDQPRAIVDPQPRRQPGRGDPQRGEEQQVQDRLRASALRCSVSGAFGFRPAAWWSPPAPPCRADCSSQTRTAMMTP